MSAPEDARLLEELEELGVEELAAALTRRGDEAAGGDEFADPQDLARRLERQVRSCPVCLGCEGVAGSSLAGSGDGALAEAEDVSRCLGCQAPFHRACAAGHALASAERGAVPPCCPVTSCRTAWTERLVAWCFLQDGPAAARYHAAARGVEELRSKGT